MLDEIELDLIRQSKLIGEENQKILENKKVLIIGIGALGTVASELLARTGARLILVDSDIVDKTNLQRQILFDNNDVGKLKAETAYNKLKAVTTRIKFFNERANKNFLENLFQKEKFDIIIDCTDNITSRFIIDDFCQKFKVPFVYGAVVGSKGMLYNVIPGKSSFRQVFGHAAKGEVCSEEGILNSVSAVIGSLQAGECMKILLEKDYCKDLIYFNLFTNTFNYVKINKKIELIEIKKEDNKENYFKKSNYSELSDKEIDRIYENDQSNEEKFADEIKEEYVSQIVVKPCKTRAGFTARHSSLKPNFDTLKLKYEVLTDAKIVLLLKTKAGEVLVQKHGELLFKTCNDQKLIKDVATDIFLS